ncbi:MAG: amidohydrolase family protein [Anaerolineae bacterium]
MQPIEAATRVGAEAIGLSHLIGRLAPGMLADILVIDGNPLADISILQDQQRLERVCKGGKLVAGRVAPCRSEVALGSEVRTC